MELEKRVDDLDSRVRALETSEAGVLSTLTHFTKSVDSFISKLEKHEAKEDKRFETFEKEIKTLARFAYIGIGAIVLFQFLVSAKIISFGGA